MFKRCALVLCVMGATLMSAEAAEIPECIKKLSKAPLVENDVLGEGARESENFKLYREACKLNIKPMGEELNWLVKNGTPAAKVYAGFIGWEVARPSVERFVSLKDDKSKVEYQSGCEVFSTTVADIAKEFIAQQHYMDFPTSIFCKLLNKTDKP